MENNQNVFICINWDQYILYIYSFKGEALISDDVYQLGWSIKSVNARDKHANQPPHSHGKGEVLGSNPKGGSTIGFSDDLYPLEGYLP